MSPQRSTGTLALLAFGFAAMVVPGHAATAARQPVQFAQATEAPAGAVSPQQSPSDMGLVRTPDTRLRIVYSLPGTDLSRFKTIQLHPLAVPPDAANAAPPSGRTRGRESFILGDREISM